MPDVVRLPTSLSRGGKCLTNLRGVFKPDGSLYDFAAPDRQLPNDETYPATKEKTTTGVWSSSIPWAYTGDFSFFFYPSLLSSSTSGTIIFRLYIKSIEYPQSETLVFYNGVAYQDGYIILLIYNGSSYSLDFANFADLTNDRITISDGSLQTNTWYQFSVSFTTTEGSTTLQIYQNGSAVPTSGSTLANAIITPTANTAVSVTATSLTDFAVFDEVLPNRQLAAFGQAPYL